MSGNGVSGDGLRAAVNGWLEEISFRTGVFIGSIVLVVIAVVGGFLAVLGSGGQAASALGPPRAANPRPAAPSAAPSTTAATQPAATPTRSAAAAPARTAVVSAPSTGSQSAAVAGYGHEGSELSSPAGWRHGFPPRFGSRGWIWGPYRGGFHFHGSRF